MLIIYDGACPFCQAYVQRLKLSAAVGHVTWLSARSDDPRIAHYQAQGYMLDEGLLVVHGEAVWAGADAMQMLAACSGPVDRFNRWNAALFSKPWLARRVYPLLKLGRRFVLWCLRRPKIQNSPLS